MLFFYPVEYLEDAGVNRYLPQNYVLSTDYYFKHLANIENPFVMKLAKLSTYKNSKVNFDSQNMNEMMCQNLRSQSIDFKFKGEKKFSLLKPFDVKIKDKSSISNYSRNRFL